MEVGLISERAMNFYMEAKVQLEHTLSQVVDYYPDGVSSAQEILNKHLLIVTDKVLLDGAEPLGNWKGPGSQGMHDASMMLIMFRGHILETDHPDRVKMANLANDLRGDIISWFEQFDD